MQGNLVHETLSSDEPVLRNLHVYLCIYKGGKCWFMKCKRVLNTIYVEQIVIVILIGK